MTAVEMARPRPRAFWSDARFLLGIVLIIVSIAGVWLVVSAARQTVPVFAAARTIVPGEEVSAGDLRVVEVALGQVGEAYTTPGTWDGGVVATRTIEAGELVPRSAIGDAARAAVTTIALRSAGDVPAAVDAGTVVEVWAAPQRERGVFDAPRILVSAATVVSVSRDDSVIGGAGTALEVVIDRADVAATLEAVSAGWSISVVPVTGAGR